MKLLSTLAFVGIMTLGQLTLQAQNVEVIKYEQLFEKTQQDNDQLIVVNFWATWCGPCVEEMPHFVELNEKYKDQQNFKLLFVSLDRSKQVDKVKQFINDYKMNAEVVLLDDNKRMNEWIPKVDATWNGNIPVTVLYKNKEKLHFVGAAMEKDELEQLIKMYMNQ